MRTIEEATKDAVSARRELRDLEHISTSARAIGQGLLTEAFFERLSSARVSLRKFDREIADIKEEARR